MDRFTVQSNSGVAGDRAVSDTVAFVLMFSVIILSVGAVSISGVTELTELRDEERLASAERNMQAVAAKLDKIHRQGDPYRQLVVPLNGGNVWIEDSSFEITSNGSAGDPITDVEGTYTTRSLNHRFDRNPYDVTVAYESGGAFRTSEVSRGLVARYPPSWRCEDDVLVVSLVRLEADEQVNVAGGFNDDIVIGPNADLPRESPIADFEQGLQLQAERNRTNTTHVTVASGSAVNVTVDPSNTAQPAEWSRYFDTTGEWTEYPTGTGEYTCTVDGNTGGSAVVVRQTVVDISV